MHCLVPVPASTKLPTNRSVLFRDSSHSRCRELAEAVSNRFDRGAAEAIILRPSSHTRLCILLIDVFLSILTNALLPVLVIVASGFALQRWRPMESATLVTLNLYFFVPVWLFVRVLDSNLKWSDIALVGLAWLGPMLVLGGAAWVLLRQWKLPSATLAALVVGGIFANAGNFGVPVAEIAFGSRGGEVHAIVVLFANFSIFSIAYMMLAMGEGEGAAAILRYFRLPYFYCVIAALLIRDLGWRETIPVWTLGCCRTIAAGLVPIALVTLGAQLAARARTPNWRLLSPSLLLQLVLLPAISLAAVHLLGMWPWPGVVVVLAASAPAAINPLLLAMQLDGDADTLSDCIFWSTLFSGVTVAIWMTILKLMDPASFV